MSRYVEDRSRRVAPRLRRRPGAPPAALGSGGTTTDSAGKPVVRIMVGGLDKQIYLPRDARPAARLLQAAGPRTSSCPTSRPASTPKPTCSPARSTAVVGFYDHNIDLQAKGKSTEAVVQMLQVPGEVELCRATCRARSSRRPTGRARTSASPTSARPPTSSPSTSPSRNGVAGRRDIHEVGVQAGHDVHRRDAAQEHRLRHDDRTDGLAPARTRARPRSSWTSRTAAGARAAFGGAYPATSLYMATDYVTQPPGRRCRSWPTPTSRR